MSLELKENKGNKEFKQVPEGPHLAIPVQVIDFGMQFVTDWQTQEQKMEKDEVTPMIRHKVWITSEFPEVTDEFDGEEKPLWIGKEFTVSTDDRANLTSLIKATNSSAKNLGDIIAAPYTATVGLTSGGKTKIVSETPCAAKVAFGDKVVPKGDVKLFNEPVVYSLEDGQNDVYGNLPDWMKEKIDNQADNATPQF